MRSLSIYVHVPFCLRKCAYCDFASWSGRETDWSRYFNTLAREIDNWARNTDFGLFWKTYRVRSMFIGGGTPTLVPAEYIREIIDRSRFIAGFDGDVEITIEGNPGTLTLEKLAVY